jgi:multiple sugar transport system substrate-binding protein
MYISGSDVYTNLVQAYNVNPSIYGVTTIPLAKNKNAGVLGGGTLAAVQPKASKARLAAAMKWISFFYEEPLVSKKQAIRNAKTLVANHQPVGVPALPLFNKKQYKLANSWIKPYINVPIGQMKPFLNGIFKQKLIPEPEASTQSVYAALNAVVEAVLTNQSTNIQQMLQQANAQAQAAIKAGQ